MHHIQKVQVHTLGGFWSQIVEALFVSNRSKESAYQSRKRTWLSHFSAGAAVGASKLRKFRRAPVFFFECFDYVIMTSPMVTHGAFGQRINECLDVTGSLPDLAWQDNRRVQPNHVATTSNKGIPPL